MPLPSRERLTGAEADFAIAVHELRQVTGSLRQWQSEAGGGASTKLEDLNRSLDRILEVDGRISEARRLRTGRQSDWKAIDDDYAAGLREAIETVQSLASLLGKRRPG